MTNLYTQKKPKSSSRSTIVFGIITVLIAILIVVFGKREGAQKQAVPRPVTATAAPAPRPTPTPASDEGTPLFFSPGLTEEEAGPSGFILPKELQ